MRRDHPSSQPDGFIKTLYSNVLFIIYQPIIDASHLPIRQCGGLCDCDEPRGPIIPSLLASSLFCPFVLIVNWCSVDFYRQVCLV